MVATTHLVVGSAIGSQIDSPLLALILGVASHHIFDFIPHLDYGDFCHKKNMSRTWLYIGADVTIALVALIFFATSPAHQPGLLWGALGSLLPDIIDNNPLWMRYTRSWPVFKQHWQFHEFLHHKLKPNQWWLNIIIQATVILLALAFIPY